MSRTFTLGVVLSTVFWLLMWALVPTDSERPVRPPPMPPSSPHSCPEVVVPTAAARPVDNTVTNGSDGTSTDDTPTGAPVVVAPAAVGEVATEVVPDGALLAIEDFPAATPGGLPPVLQRGLDSFIKAVNESRAFDRHQSFAALWRATVMSLDVIRIQSVRSQTAVDRTSCFEFLRLREQRGDEKNRVPCIPYNASGLMAVESVPFGVVATFAHKARQAADVVDAEGGTTAPQFNSKDGPLRVAVEMSGHMRTFSKCAESLRENLLKPNGALLFAATYPDLGDKRFGVREQELDDAVQVEVLRDLYGADHWAALYLVDLPTARKELSRAFPTLFILKQWSWMIYQLFMMELAHNITEAHLGVISSSEAHGRFPRLSRRVVLNPDDERIRLSWGGASDVYVRVRPDLYVMGLVRLTRGVGGAVWFNYRCGDHDYKPVLVNTTTVLRSTHHPVWLWAKDPLSDHSAVGLPKAMGAFLRLFSDSIKYAPQSQEKRIFYHGQTAEKLWGEHAVRQGLTVAKVPGWHLMLRKAGKFNNGTLQASGFKKKLISLVFGATDAKSIGCAAHDNTNIMLTHPPKPPKKKKFV